MQSAREYFDYLNHAYVAVHKAKEDLFWSTYMATTTDQAGFVRAESAYKEFIGDPAKLAKTREELAAVRAAPPGAERDALLHGLEGWLALFEANIIDSPEGRSLMREIVDAEAVLFEQKRAYEPRHVNEQGEWEVASLPMLATNLAASGVTSSGATLTWTASTDNVGVTGYDVLRAPGASGGTFAVVGTPAGTTFTDSGLAANTTYRYQVRARDAAGNTSAVSGTVPVTTQSGGGNPGGCSITLVTQTQWQTGYVIQPARVTNTGTAPITGWTVTVTLPSGHTMAGSWNATQSVSGQTVTFRGVSYNSNLAPGASGEFGFQVGR